MACVIQMFVTSHKLHLDCCSLAETVVCYVAAYVPIVCNNIDSDHRKRTFFFFFFLRKKLTEEQTKKYSHNRITL